MFAVSLPKQGNQIAGKWLPGLQHCPEKIYQYRSTLMDEGSLSIELIASITLPHLLVAVPSVEEGAITESSHPIFQPLKERITALQANDQVLTPKGQRAIESIIILFNEYIELVLENRGNPIEQRSLLTSSAILHGLEGHFLLSQEMAMTLLNEKGEQVVDNLIAFKRSDQSSLKGAQQVICTTFEALFFEEKALIVEPVKLEGVWLSSLKKKGGCALTSLLLFCRKNA